MGFAYVQTHQIYTFSMCSSLYISYTSINSVFIYIKHLCGSNLKLENYLRGLASISVFPPQFPSFPSNHFFKKYISLKSIKTCKKNPQHISALVGMAQWLEHWPTHRKVVGLFPVRCTYLGCMQVCSPALVGVGVGGNQSICLSHPCLHLSISVSPSPQPSLPLSLKINGKKIPG